MRAARCAYQLVLGGHLDTHSQRIRVDREHQTRKKSEADKKDVWAELSPEPCHAALRGPRALLRRGVVRAALEPWHVNRCDDKGELRIRHGSRQWGLEVVVVAFLSYVAIE